MPKVTDALRHPSLRFIQSRKHWPHSVIGRAFVKYTDVQRRVSVAAVSTDVCPQSASQNKD